jgi:RNA polymerase sigma factor (sigma-70 family)
MVDRTRPRYPDLPRPPEAIPAGRPGRKRAKTGTSTALDTDLRDLLARVRDGDQVAWTMLTGRFTNLLWSIARSMRLGEADAADVVQTTWLRLVENIDSIREPERLASWLATTARRESSDARRRSARLRPGGLDTSDDWDEVESSDDPVDEALLRDERDAALWQALRALKPACQRLLRVMIADPPPSYAEISAALDIPVGSIGPSRQRCLRSLREILLAQSEDFRLRER